MAEAALEELEASNSNFDYAVLQATDNSIPFYESLGFKRVGAVARYSLREEDGSLADYKFEESHITSHFYWYTKTMEDETVRQVAAKLDIPVFDIIFLNRGLLYDGLNANSR